MDRPSNAFKLQQSWTPHNTQSNRNQRLVADNNNENSFNNLGYNISPTALYHNQNCHNFNYSSSFDNNNFKIKAPSPINKKPSNQKFGQWSVVKQSTNLVSIKSKIGVEYRRYSLMREAIAKFDDFYKKVESIHQLFGTAFSLHYYDQDGEILPINNDDNLARAIDASGRLKTNHVVISHNNNYCNPNNQFQQQPNMQQVVIERPYLKLYIETKNIPSHFDYVPNSNMKCKRKDGLINMLIPSSSNIDSRPRIGMPEDFRQVSSIIDVDILPATRRRVVLKRGGSDKPLGFYIREGTYHRLNSHGVMEKNYGIFISRLVPGGLAESTNLLAENDEILEVNGIEIDKNKRLDQVRDMMVANSSNLIITTRPAKPFNSNYQKKLRCKNAMTNYNNGRDRLPSNNSDITEDIIKHHIY